MYDGKYDITVLHDDAFIISREDGSSVALEPSYFDKTYVERQIHQDPLDNLDLVHLDQSRSRCQVHHRT
mgnify:CR=1 FL=1